MTFRRRGILGFGNGTEKVIYGHSGMITNDDRNFQSSQFEYASKYGAATESWSITGNFADIIGSGASPSAVNISPDGRYMYIGRSNNSSCYILRYRLDIPYDVHSYVWEQSITTNSFGVSSIESFAISPDGHYLWTASYYDYFHTFHMSSPHDISTITKVGQRDRKNWFSNSNVNLGYDTNPRGVFFKPDGTKGYMMGNAYDHLHEYNLTTAFDVTTMTHNQRLDLEGINSSPVGIWFKPDGSSFFFIGQGGTDTVYKRDLSTAWDISTQSDGGSWAISPNYGYYSIAFSNDGTKLYLGADDNKIRQWTLATGWDLSSSFTDDGWTLGGFNFGGTVTGIAFNSDGTEVAVQCQSSSYYVPMTLTTPYVLSGGHTYVTGKFQEVSANPIGISYPWGLATLGTGQMVILSDEGSDAYGASTINAVHLAESDNLKSLQFGSTKSTDLQSSNSDPRGLIWKYDGTKYYVFDEDDRGVYQYRTDIPFLINKMTSHYETYKSTYSGSSADPKGFAMSLDGRHMWFADTQFNQIYQYDLTTPWDITDGVAYRGYSVDFSQRETGARGMSLVPSGNKLLMVGETTDNLVEFSVPS